MLFEEHPNVAPAFQNNTRPKYEAVSDKNYSHLWFYSSLSCKCSGLGNQCTAMLDNTVIVISIIVQHG
jgi:hypothetical protein